MTETLIPFIYASTSGNTETVMERVAQVFQEHGLQPKLFRSERTPIEIIQEYPQFVLGTSTWEHGALNPFFRPLLKSMKQLNLAGKAAAFVGCGDRRYEPYYFCEGIEILKREWLKTGGQQLGETLKIQGEAYAILDTLVQPWAEGLIPVFKSAQPSPETGMMTSPGLAGKLQKVLGI
jgi:flavodoxin